MSHVDDLERLKRKLHDAERRLELAEEAAILSKMDREVERQAGAMGFADPTLMVRLVDRSAIHHDADSGSFTGVAEALERVRRDFPNLVLGQRPASGGGSPAAMELKRPARPAPDQGSRPGAEKLPTVREFFLQTGRYSMF